MPYGNTKKLIKNCPMDICLFGSSLGMVLGHDLSLDVEEVVVIPGRMVVVS